MRTLSPTLLAAQRSASAVPYVKVEVVDQRPTVARPVFQRLYVGTEPDFHHAATMPGDGSLVRARVDPSSGNLYVQRVASPGPGSDFGAWTLLNTASTTGNVALASLANQVLLLYVDPVTGTTIRMRESTDYGASWSGPGTILTPPQRTRHLAAAISPSGVAGLFYSPEDQSLWVAKRVNGVWSSQGSWPYSAVVTTLRGHACIHDGDWCLVVCGQTLTGENKVWTVIYGDGVAEPFGNWSALREVVRASQGAGVEFKYPALSKPDAYRLWHVESYSGSGSYSRPVGAFSQPGSTYSDNRWRDAVPFDLSCTYGVALAQGNSYLWLTTPSCVWRSATSQTPLPLTNDVLALDLVEAPGRGYAAVTLRNDDGRYNSPGSGNLSALRLGSRVNVSPGYQTSAGLEASDGPTLWVEGWEHQHREGRATFVLRLEDAWSILAGWRARRQQTWAAGQASIQSILNAVLACVGMQLVVLSASDTFTSHKPDFTIHPGEDGATAVKRLMSLVPDGLFFRSGTLYVKRLQPTDPVDYAYGTGHVILEARYAGSAARYNRVQAYGQGVTGEAFGWPSVEELHDRLMQVHDLNLTSPEAAQARADALIAKETRRCTGGEATVPANCGQELYDVVEVTDAHAGLAAARRRVMGLRLRYEAGPRLGPEAGPSPRYTHTLTLGGE